MNVLFLDIDGVLNSAKYINVIYERNISYIKSGSEYRESMDDVMDPECIKRLNKITDITKASIVISSTWRIKYRKNLYGLCEELIARGITGKIIGMTPILNMKRGDEIQKYINDNKCIDKFVIIDDNGGMGNLSNYWVRTEFAFGLQDEHVEEIIKRLL
jgi:hypothetical protein